MQTGQIVAVGTPAACEQARRAGFRTMAPAWRAEQDALAGPAPLSCDIVCVVGQWEGDFTPLAGALAAECRRASARGLFLDFVLPADAWPTLALLFPPGLRLFAPLPEDPISAEQITWVAKLPAAGEGFAEAVLRLPDGCAAFLPLVRRKTKIGRAGAAEALSLSGEELARLLHEKRPSVYRSAGQMADYFTMSADGQTVFYLFDSRETVTEKLSLLQKRNVDTVFMLWEGLMPLLAMEI